VLKQAHALIKQQEAEATDENVRLGVTIEGMQISPLDFSSLWPVSSNGSCAPP
jgi:hypothetical protein